MCLFLVGWGLSSLILNQQHTQKKKKKRRKYNIFDIRFVPRQQDALNLSVVIKQKTQSHDRELVTRQVSQCKIFNHLDIVNMKLKFQIELLYWLLTRVSKDFTYANPCISWRNAFYFSNFMAVEICKIGSLSIPFNPKSDSLFSCFQSTWLFLNTQSIRKP